MKRLLFMSSLFTALIPLVGSCGCCCGKAKFGTESKSVVVASPNGAQAVTERGDTAIPTEAKIRILERRILNERSKAYKTECSACKERGESIPVFCEYDYVRKGWNFKRKNGDAYFIGDKKGIVPILRRKVDEMKSKASK